MKPTTLLTLTFAAVTLVAGVASARPLLPRGVVVAPAPSVRVSPRVVRAYEIRQARTMDELTSGVRSGVLTNREFERLLRRHQKLERRIQKALHDGVLTRSEMRAIDHAFAKVAALQARLERNTEVAYRAYVRPTPAPKVLQVAPAPRRVVVHTPAPRVRIGHTVHPAVVARGGF